MVCKYNKLLKIQESARSAATNIQKLNDNHVSVVFSRGLGFAQSEKQICTTATYVPEYRFRDPLYHPLRDERGDPVRWALDVCNPDPAGLAIHTIAGPHVPDTGLGYYRILCPDCNDKHDGVYAFLLIRLK